MKRMLLAAAVILMAGCGTDPADAFRHAVPTADAVALKVPARVGQALQGDIQRRQDAVEGQRANLYAITRAVTLSVNGGTAAVLGLVKAITDNAPTSLTGNVAVWGPHTDALSPNTFRFTVTQNQANDYSYVLEAKAKGEPDTAFKAILSGSHVVATDAHGKTLENHGHGTFLIDWNQMQKLPEHGTEVGTARVTYARPSPQDDTQIDALFSQVKDGESGQLVDATYHYRSTPASGGNFEFTVVKNLDSDPAKSALERAAIRSRWQQTGAGRSDVKAIGGDLPGAATLSECWDDNFLSRYLSFSWAQNAGYGAESACAFKTAEFSVLAP